MPVSECSFVLESLFEDLMRDPWRVENKKRPIRTSGQAVQIATHLMEIAFGRNGGRILSFVGGPCTMGPGQVASLEKKDALRSHADLEKKKAPYVEDAIQFYTDLAAKLNSIHVVLDAFVCSLDQVGLMEMSHCILKTGGLIVMGESFNQSLFKESLRRVFTRISSNAFDSEQKQDQGALNTLAQDEGLLAMGFGGSVEVLTSRDIKLNGCIGPCSSLPNKTSDSRVSDTVIGEGGAYAWNLGAVTDQTTLAFYFEMNGSVSESNTSQAPPQQQPQPPMSSNPMMSMNNDYLNSPPQGHQHHHHRRRVVQFLTHYFNAAGRPRLRVTTVSGPWMEGSLDNAQNKQMVAASFDQECAAALMARLSIFKTKQEDLPTVVRWLDRSLIRLCGKFGTYQESQPSTFSLGPEFRIFPQFMFHLRRSPFLQHVNASPDEGTYLQSTLCRESVSNCLIMIQPSLLSYSFQGPPQPALLDASSIRPDAILLLDTFFHVVIYHGEKIAAWRNQGFAESEEHTNFRDLLYAPQNDAQMIMENRFPAPKYVLCDQGKSEARFVLARLNPSITHHNADGSSGYGSQPIFTDDVSLRVFMDHLVNLACAP
jgi:protein transport protein SEC23